MNEQTKIPIFMDNIHVINLNLVKKKPRDKPTLFSKDFDELDFDFFETNGLLYEGVNKPETYDGIRIHLCSRCSNIYGDYFLEALDNQDEIYLWFFSTINQQEKSTEEFYKKHSSCKNLIDLDNANKVVLPVVNKQQSNIVEIMGWMSKRIQQIDFNLVGSDIHEDPNFKCYYYFEDNLPKGYLVFNQNDRLNDEITTTTIWDIFVFESFRKQGIADKLLNHFFHLQKTCFKDYKLALNTPMNIHLASIILRKISEYNINEVYFIHERGYNILNYSELETKSNEFRKLIHDRKMR